MDDYVTVGVTDELSITMNESRARTWFIIFSMLGFLFLGAMIGIAIYFAFTLNRPEVIELQRQNGEADGSSLTDPGSCVESNGMWVNGSCQCVSPYVGPRCNHTSDTPRTLTGRFLEPSRRPNDIYISYIETEEYWLKSKKYHTKVEIGKLHSVDYIPHASHLIHDEIGIYSTHKFDALSVPLMIKKNDTRSVYIHYPDQPLTVPEVWNGKTIYFMYLNP